MSKLYIHTEDVHNLCAPREVVPIVLDLVKPSSILDVGCGTGTWLKAFEERGIIDYMGIDGDYMEMNLLKIPIRNFVSLDLRKEWSLNRKFDLVISLEVAEHLEERYAEHFVNTLVLHGDVIVFSAAIPGQGGQFHVNEQWLSYWVALFKKFQFNFYDPLRPQIWNNTQVDLWYRQNLVVFCKEGLPLNKVLSEFSSSYIDLIHPKLFEFYAKQAERAVLYEQGKLGIRTALNSIIKAFRNKVK